MKHFIKLTETEEFERCSNKGRLTRARGLYTDEVSIIRWKKENLTVRSHFEKTLIFMWQHQGVELTR